jgi:hypothetical protein
VWLHEIVPFLPSKFATDQATTDRIMGMKGELFGSKATFSYAEIPYGGFVNYEVLAGVDACERQLDVIRAFLRLCATQPAGK